MRFLASLVFLAASLSLTGCGGEGGSRLPTVPVKGNLLIDGKAFGPCTVSLSATNVDPDPKKAAANRAPNAVVNPDGSFVLTTYKEGDGAPVGIYNVTIAADISKMQLNPVPVCKPLTVEIAKSADGKPVELELKLESTGETSSGAGASAIMRP